MLALRISEHLQAELHRAIHDSNLSYLPSIELKPPAAVEIRAGKVGGLPFDSLITDLVSGCLSARQACYGTCFAAKAAWNHGIDFGIRQANILNPAQLEDDLRRLPIGQRHLRNGWNSDPSWDWVRALALARIVRASGRHIIFITKAFMAMPTNLIAGFVETGAEIRLSISAMDSNSQLERRLKFIKHYRRAGGVTIPILMSACYRDARLMARQERLVNWLIREDLPAAENSLRFPTDLPISTLLDRTRTRQIAHSRDIWSGRLYSDRLSFPTTTTVPPWYEGLPSGYLSQLDPDFIQSLFTDPVVTHDQVISCSEELHPPQQCGVAIRFG